jgi:hypothetical protein
MQRPNVITTCLLSSATNEQQTKELKSVFIATSAINIRKAVCKVAEKRIHNSVLKSDSTDRFDSPAYPYQQASEAGYRKAWREILDLLDR